jgi:hypothetical protein
MKRSYQAKYYPTLLCGISRWTASPKIIYSTPVNPRLEKMLSMWMLKPSAHVAIQGTRITGRYEDAIRESIDGSYLRHYLSVKHKWSDSTLSWIDWYIATNVSSESAQRDLPVAISGSSSSMTSNPPTPKNSVHEVRRRLDRVRPMLQDNPLRPRSRSPLSLSSEHPHIGCIISMSHCPSTLPGTQATHSCWSSRRSANRNTLVGTKFFEAI